MRHRFCHTSSLAFVVACALQSNTTIGFAGGYEVSAPVVHGNLAVYPVHGTTAGSAAPLTLEQGMARGQVRIREMADGRHEIDNLSDRQIFIQAGDLVRGGSQDQVIATTVLVPPHALGLPIAMFCVERDRSAPANGQTNLSFSAAGLIPSQTAKLSLLTHAPASSTSEKLRRIGVWLSVESLTADLSRAVDAPVRSPASPSSLPLALQDSRVRQAYQPYLDAIAELGKGSATLIGAVFAINGEIHGADIYASTELFREMWPKLLRAASIQAVARRGERPGVAPGARDAEMFLAEMASGQTTKGVYVVTQQANGAWVHKGYAAKVADASTELEGALLKALETRWSIPLPVVGLGATTLRRYHEALLIEALAGQVAGRGQAIEQARRAGLPVDAQQYLRDDVSRLATMGERGSSQSSDAPWLLAVMGLAVLATSTLRRRWLAKSQQAALPQRAVAQAIAARPSASLPQVWWPERSARAGHIGRRTTSVPSLPRKGVADSGGANLKREARELVSA